MVRLDQLRIGTPFRCGSLVGKLVALSPVAATVEVRQGARRFVARLVDAEGETVEKVVEITGGKKHMTMSTATEVEALS